MIGCKPLDDKEIELIVSHLHLRDKALVITGIKTGFRISELLSLKVCDVLKFNKIVDRIIVERKNMKGNISSRSVVTHDIVKHILILHIELNNLKNDDYLFKSQKGENKSISRIQAHRIIKGAVTKAQLNGKISTHSLRKTFANNMYEKLNHDLVKTQKALGHKAITSTVSYLSFNEDDIDKAVLDK